MALDGAQPDVPTAEAALSRARVLVEEIGYHLRDADLLILEGRLVALRDDREVARKLLEQAITVARREEAQDAVYQAAVDEANRYLRELTEAG